MPSADFKTFQSVLLIGDIVVTRNLTENITPGYWNHGSVYVGDGIVEARSSKKGVVQSEVEEFYNRYPYIVVMRLKNITPEEQIQLVKSAKNLIGRPYWYLSSIWRKVLPFSLGENCVSTPRRTYYKALEFDFGWHIPDHIVTDDRFIKIIEKK